MQAEDKVILFDGVCVLCCAWSQFIIHHDPLCQFKLATVQSPEGQAILRYFSMPQEHFDTMVYVEGYQKFEKSDAFLKVVKQLGGLWKLFSILRIIPRAIRDWFYDRIALNRYRWFGKYNQCLLPQEEFRSRLLSEITEPCEDK